MIRAAVLFDERDRKIGQTMVTDSTFVIQHRERFFFRTDKGVRLLGGGVGAQFLEMEPLVRNKLEPA
jgi:hypothetical protein